MKEFMLIASLVLSFCILILCRDYIVFMLKNEKVSLLCFFFRFDMTLQNKESLFCFSLQ